MMRCPTLKDLPPPPIGKSGWPWTVESHQLPNRMPDGKKWPKISIVTPSYNQGQFIEETIRSVLLQGYPNLEYIIIDGGSNDQSVIVIKKYETWLSHWISEVDEGQADAINKGFNAADGLIGAYLNSDDYYIENIFHKIVNYFIDKKAVILFGNNKIADENSTLSKDSSGYMSNITKNEFKYPFYCGAKKYNICQESTFWLLDKKIQFDKNLQFCMDVDFFIRKTKYGNICLIADTLGVFRIHSKSKSTNLQNICDSETLIIKSKYKKYKLPTPYILLLIFKYRLHILISIFSRTKKPFVYNIK